ncbi:unnamed protein product (macronuclear) [Paramecium tetraurelia]|uniref:Protoporphyrinogen oxidase n=1 Tax=Paramecium tetraurelia TaxID=5888 RepID=A0DSA9_PARTE|nr:uncharacterized protein GSPATT00019630001 [Paramecium tetraurelia]CAK85926.1 unnamed protein product [Paramecium tetraurelia]|eukprot:XP_001453323.1 hypothetical protein (macronuclear) [Paramecium tetraurelia strain d4-2]
MSYRFVVVGAGISGLSNAFFIKQLFPKAKITLIESSNRVGGMITTTKENQFICEEGPRSIKRGKYDRPLFYMIDKIGLYPELVTSVQQPYSYIYWEGGLKSIPQQKNLQTISRFIKENRKDELLNLMKAVPKILFPNQKSDNLGEYFDEIVGKELTQKYAETAFYGLYGESVYKLSKNMCLSKIYMSSYDEDILAMDLIYDDEFEQIRMKKLMKANSYRFAYGLDSLPKRILRYLKDNSKEQNLEIQLNTKGKEIDVEQRQLVTENENQEIKRIEYDYLFLNIPSSEIVSMLENSTLNGIKEDLKKIKNNSIITRNICWDQKILPPDFRGLGYLVNPNQNQNILGMVADSLQFPKQYPKKSTSLTVMTIKDVKDDEVLAELSSHLGVKVQDPKMIMKKHWMKNFIQFQPGYYENLQRLEKELENMKIIIGGNHYTMVIPELVYLAYSKMKQLYV